MPGHVDNNLEYIVDFWFRVTRVRFLEPIKFVMKWDCDFRPICALECVSITNGGKLRLDPHLSTKALLLSQDRI